MLVQGRWWVANVAGVTAGSSAVLVNGRVWTEREGDQEGVKGVKRAVKEESRTFLLPRLPFLII